MRKRFVLAILAAGIACTAAVNPRVPVPDAAGEAVTGYWVGGGGGPVPNPVDSRPCIFFQTGGGHQWYAVAQSDGNYNEERDFLKLALAARFPVWFWVGAQQCGGWPVVGALSTYAP